MIISLNYDCFFVGTAHEQPLPHKIKPTLDFIGVFKTTSGKQIHQDISPNFHWQRNYYEHIIRDKRDREQIINYMLNNPHNWHHDRNHPNY